MKLVNVIAVYSVLTIQLVWGQNDILRFNLGASSHSYKMETLNTFLSAEGTEVNELYGSPQITRGLGYSFGIEYKLSNNLIFGIGGNHQSGSDNKQVPKSFTNILTGEITNYTVDTEVTTTSNQLLLFVGYAFSDALGWTKKENFLNKIELTIGLNGGWAKSKLTDRNFNTFNYSEGIRLMNHYSQDLVFLPQIRLSYGLTKSNLFSSIGLHLGYQILRTNHVESEAGKLFNFLSQENFQEIDLDFSGLKIGTFLSIGK